MYQYSLDPKKYHEKVIPGDNNSMTCVGLIALAIGRELKGINQTKSLIGKPPSALHEPSADRRKSPLPGSAPSKVKDIHILKGLANLYHHIGVPTGQMDEQVPPQDCYFLWSLERVAMLYNLPTLADKEWYRWGAEILVTNQDPGGGFPRWRGQSKELGNIDPGLVVNTSFALLFLKHSHPMKDLTPKLTFTTKELNTEIARLRTADKSLAQPTTSPGESRNRAPLPPVEKKP